MWVLPKSIISVCAVDTEELTSDSEQFCLMCEQSLMWRSKPSVLRTWSLRLKRVGWMKHLFGRTLKPSMQNLFAERWTSYLEASRANHSPKQGDEKVMKTLAISSQVLKELYPSASQESSSSKMSKGLFPQNSEMSLTPLFSNMSWKDWKIWVTTVRQNWSQRAKLQLHTEEREYSSSAFPTPSVSDTEGAPKVLDEKGRRVSQTTGTVFGAKLMDYVHWATPNTLDGFLPRTEEGTKKMAQGQRKGRTRPSNLREQVDEKSVEIYERENWPTPDTMTGHRTGKAIDPEEWKKHAEKHAKRGVNAQFHLNVAVNWPSPATRDYKGTNSREHIEKAHKEGRKGHIGQLPNVVKYPDLVGGNTLKGSSTDSPQDQTKSSTNGSNRELLNPDWVESLMGVEQGWTDLGCWGTV